MPNTRYAGVLHEHHLVVLRLIGARGALTANIISRKLGRPRGQLSDQLRHMRKHGYIVCNWVGSASSWSLTEKGRLAVLNGTGNPDFEQKSLVPIAKG